MSDQDPDAKPKISAPIDDYGEGARTYFRSRRATTSAQFFTRYLKPGMTLLDCGCGEGTITVDLAEIVAPGKVEGIDLSSDSIEFATQLAARRNIATCRFQQGTVYELPFPDASFDAVFSHALFEHLTDKGRALREVDRVLKPQGIVGLRSPDFVTRIIEPFDPVIDEFWQLSSRIRDELGGDSQMGRRLYGILQDGGFTGVMSSASCESFGTPESQQSFTDAMSHFAMNSHYSQEWVQRGWVKKERLAEISDAFQAWVKHPNAFAVWWVWGEAVGWKI